MLSSQSRTWGETATCAGRPFLVNGEGRTAGARQRHDWALDFSSLAVHMIGSSERRQLSSWWTHSALAAHASTASFTRFTLHLLSQGAPPELISGAHQAVADELRHARIAFGMAGAYAGADIGPGILDITDALR